MSEDDIGGIRILERFEVRLDIGALMRKESVTMIEYIHFFFRCPRKKATRSGQCFFFSRARSTEHNPATFNSSSGSEDRKDCSSAANLDVIGMRTEAEYPESPSLSTRERKTGGHYGGCRGHQPPAPSRLLRQTCQGARPLR